MGKWMSKPRRHYSASEDFVQESANSRTKKGRSNSLDYSLMDQNIAGSGKWIGMVNARQCHSDAVSSISTIAPSICISGSKDQSIVVQNLETGSIVQRWNEHTREVSKICSRNNMVSSGSRDLTIKIWNIDSKSSLSTLIGHKLVVTAVDFNADCSQLCSGSRDNSVQVWDLETQQSIADNTLSRNLVTDVRWLVGENLIVQTSEDKIIKLWDPRIMEVVHSFPPQSQIQTCCDISGYYCITGNNGFGGQGCQLNLWDLRQKEKLHEYRGHTEMVTSCTFIESSTSTRFFTSCSHDGTVRLWQEHRSQCTSCEQLDVGQLTCIASLSADTLLCGSFDQGIRVIRRGVSGRLVAAN